MSSAGYPPPRFHALDVGVRGVPNAGHSRMKITAELSAGLAGRHVVEREIGRGGMAVVYLARDIKHDRLVAVKSGA